MSDMYPFGRKRRRKRSRRKRLSTTARGYGAAHQARRRMLAPLVAAGLAVCARCGLQIERGQAWDLGHVDGDRSRYSGPEHRHSKDCPEGGNRATARRRPEPPGPPHWDERSRIW